MQITFTGALTLLFIGLQLGGAISWPWLWVLSPLWLWVAFILAMHVVVGLVVLPGKMAEALDRRRRKRRIYRGMMND